jgi:predicted secreted protein with PEFG-CTERM motif
MDYKAYALMAILLASVASVALVGTAHAQSTALTVETDADSYATGDEITISGEVGTVQAGQPILLRVTDPKGVLVRVDQVQVAADGSYSYSFPAGGLMKNSGTHTVSVSYRNTDAETTFDFTADMTGPQWRFANLQIEDQTYRIRYQITGGTLAGLTADPDLAMLTAMITSTADGTLTLELPRNVMQSLTVEGQPTGGSDVDYEAFIDGIPGDAVQTSMTDSARVVTVDFDQGAEEIELVGTWVVPEFGAIAAIVLAVAIVGIIVATARYSKFSSFVPRH